MIWANGRVFLLLNKDVSLYTQSLIVYNISVKRNFNLLLWQINAPTTLHKQSLDV